MQSLRRLPFIRCLTGSEMWNVHSLSTKVKDSLKSCGASDADFGRWAGASIPAEMCSVQVEKLNGRITLAHSVENLMEGTTSPWMHFRAPNVRGEWGHKLILVVMSVTQSGLKMLTALRNQVLPGKCFSPNEKALCRVDTTERWARLLMIDPALIAFLAAELQEEDLWSQMVVVPVSEEAVVVGAEWVDVDSLHGTGLAQLNLLASLRARV